MGENFIVDRVVANVEGVNTKAVWYQFRIPLMDYDRRIGYIEDFKSVRFMRLRNNFV